MKKNPVVAGIEDQTVECFEEKKNPKFEIYKDKSGKFASVKKHKIGRKFLLLKAIKLNRNATRDLSVGLKILPMRRLLNRNNHSAQNESGAIRFFLVTHLTGKNSLNALACCKERKTGI